MKKFFLLACCLLSLVTARTQCEYPVDTTDEFDSIRLIVYKPINIGYMVPSQVETSKGPKLIEEAKLLFTFTQNDSVDAFFMTLAVPEWEYEPIEKDFNVWFRLSDDEIINLYNIPDRGTFDPSTNMRLYQHTLAIPLDLFYNLTHHTIQKIRIRYTNKKRTITLSEAQQKEVRKAIRCIGERVRLFPIKP